MSSACMGFCLAAHSTTEMSQTGWMCICWYYAYSSTYTNTSTVLCRLLWDVWWICLGSCTRHAISAMLYVYILDVTCCSNPKGSRGCSCIFASLPACGVNGTPSSLSLMYEHWSVHQNDFILRHQTVPQGFVSVICDVSVLSCSQLLEFL